MGNLEQNIPDSIFKKEMIESGLIPEKKMRYAKEIINHYNEFKDNINKINSNGIKEKKEESEEIEKEKIEEKEEKEKKEEKDGKKEEEEKDGKKEEEEKEGKKEKEEKEKEKEGEKEEEEKEKEGEKKEEKKEKENVEKEEKEEEIEEEKEEEKKVKEKEEKEEKEEEKQEEKGKEENEEKGKEEKEKEKEGEKEEKEEEKQEKENNSYIVNNNEVNIIYKIENEFNIYIFGDEFVNNNKDKCKIVFENKELELASYFYIKDHINDNLNELQIKLKYINNITNMSYMFFGCISLSSLPDIS